MFADKRAVVMELTGDNNRKQRSWLEDHVADKEGGVASTLPAQHEESLPSPANPQYVIQKYHRERFDQICLCIFWETVIFLARK